MNSFHHIYIPISATRDMPTNWSPRRVVLHHLPETDADPHRETVRDALLHWAALMEAATVEAGTELVRNCAGYGPVFDGPGITDRLEVAKQQLLAMLRADYLLEAERYCAEDLSRLCARYQARLVVLVRAMRQAENPSEVLEWLESKS